MSVWPHHGDSIRITARLSLQSQVADLRFEVTSEIYVCAAKTHLFIKFFNTNSCTHLAPDSNEQTNKQTSK
ncbi:MAG: hypothetical protein MHMPM18_002454 [Marteilia pararefringens]